MNSLLLLLFCNSIMSYNLYRRISFRTTAYSLGSVIAANSYFSSHSKNKRHHTVLCESFTGGSVITNPLLKKDSLPLFEEIKSENVLPAVEYDLNQLKTKFSDLESLLLNPQSGDSWGTKRIEYDYETVVEQMERIQSPLSYSWGVVGHLMGVRNSDDLRKAHDEIQPQVIEVYQKIGQSQPLYKAMKALKERNSVWKFLDDTQKRIITSSIRQMESSGVGLDSSSREKFNKLQLELAELSTKFSNNVLDSTKQYKLTVTDPKDIEGLPASVKALLSKQYSNKNNNEESTPENGPWLITLDMPSYLPCMQHIKNREIRETIYKARVRIASSDEHDNVPIIKRILQIKQEMSKLLGYANFAEKSLASKMAPSVASVLELTEMLREKAMPAALKEIDELSEFASQSGFKEKLELWDIPFWSERLREKQYEYEEEQLRVYFPLPTVLNGLFSLANRLFDITIQKVNVEEEKIQVWNKDVLFFRIVDNKSQEHIASFYLDPYSRPAEKRGGAWMDVCVGKSKVLDKKPVAYLTCNGSPPVDENTPSLMTFGEVETLFHEFGHGLQHMLTRVEHGDAAGINNIEWDAVELPSQFMENWCYDRPTLYGFAKHYQTQEPLPEELFQKVKAAKNFQSGLAMLRQLYFGAMDMRLHSEYDPYGAKSPFEIQHEMASKYTVRPPLLEDRFLCSFGHIFAGGYSAGYYSYKWAEVMSADAFAAFEEVGLDNEEAVKATGLRFRDTVLSLGGGTHPSDVFKSFRGRDPSPEALLRHSGLISEKNN